MKWMSCGQPEMSESWPQIDGKAVNELGISQLQRILILQALRPDRVLASLEKLVISTFKNPNVLSLREIMTTESDTYYVFIVTPGSDPSIELKEIAMEIPSVGEQNFIELALGECDSVEALSLVKQSARQGQWAVIKNVHLDISFLQQLEKLLPSLNAKDSFKLILTTEATTSFPNVLLQSSSKIAYEAPPGLINQMKRTLAIWNDDWFMKQDKRIKRALISLAHLHGVLQERRAFLPVGWSQFFEFTQADLNAAAEIIAQRCDSVDVVRGLLETTVYGSRMDSAFDRRILSTFVKNSFPAKSTKLFDIPADPTLGKVTEMLSQANVEDGPALLELCPNANATIARSTLVTSFRFLAILGAAASSDDEGVGKLNHHQQVAELIKQFPATVDEVQVVLANHPALDFISVQRATAHRLIRQVRNELNQLDSVADVSLLPSHLRSILASLKKNVVPQEWYVDWIDIDPCDEWIDELFQRTAAIDAIAVRLKDHSILTSQPVPLFSTIRPAAFISAILQTAARLGKIEIDEMAIKATFDVPASGAYISLNICDLSIQAGTVKNFSVIVSESPNNDIEKLEKVYLSVVPKSSLGRGIVLPIFESLNRDSLVCEVEVPCGEDTESIVLASVALVINHP
jgi:dynein heavy chain 2